MRISTGSISIEDFASHMQKVKDRNPVENSENTLSNILIQEKSDGQYSTFEDFYQGHFEYVRNLVFRIGVTNDLEDVVQGTFVSAWLHLQGFRKQSSLKTWLSKIAINKAYKSLQKEHGTRDLDDLGDPGANLAQDAENTDLVKKALDILNLDFRIPLVLAAVYGFTTEEIAKMLSIPSGTVKSRLSRARSMIKKYIESCGVIFET